MPQNHTGLSFRQHSVALTSTRTHPQTEKLASLTAPLSRGSDPSNFKTVKVTIVTSTFSGLLRRIQNHFMGDDPGRVGKQNRTGIGGL